MKCGVVWITLKKLLREYIIKILIGVRSDGATDADEFTCPSATQVVMGVCKAEV